MKIASIVLALVIPSGVALAEESVQSLLKKTVLAKVECDREWNASESRFHGRILTLEKIADQKLSVSIDEYSRADGEANWIFERAIEAHQYAIDSTSADVVSTDAEDHPVGYKLHYYGTENGGAKAELKYVRMLGHPFGEQGLWFGIQNAAGEETFRCGYYPVVRDTFYLCETD